MPDVKEIREKLAFHIEHGGGFKLLKEVDDLIVALVAERDEAVEIMRALADDVENKWGDPHTFSAARVFVEKHAPTKPQSA